MPESSDNILDEIIDLSDEDVVKVGKRAEANYVVKIARPSTLKSRIERDGDKHIAEISDSEFKTDSFSFYKHREITDDDLKKIDTMNWGSFNIEKLIDLLCNIAEALTGKVMKPYQLPIQKRIFRSLLLGDGKSMTVLLPRQSGKTEVMASSALTLLIAMPALAKAFPDKLGKYQYGFKVGVYAPTDWQADLIFSRVVQMSNSERAKAVMADPDINVEPSGKKGSFSNGSRIFSQTASPKANIEGETTDLVITDETQDIKEAVIMKSISPTRAWTNAPMISIGTCDEDPCWFYDRIQINRMRDVKIPFEHHNHYEFDYNEVIKYNPDYKRHIDEAIDDYGIESRFFQMKYGLKWFFEESRPVTDANYKRFMQFSQLGFTAQTSPEETCVVGIDVGQSPNSTVVTVGKLVNNLIEYTDQQKLVQAVQICDFLELQKVNYADLRPIILSFLQNYPNIAVITIDSTGGGKQFFEEAEREWGHICREIIPYNFTPKSKNDLMTLFFEYFWNRRIIVPGRREVRMTERWQKFYLQLVNIEKRVKNGYAVLEKNDRETSHDDYPDSLFLTLHSANIARKYYRPVQQDDSVGFYRSPRDMKPKTLEEVRDRFRRNKSGSMREQRLNKLIRGSI